MVITVKKTLEESGHAPSSVATKDKEKTAEIHANVEKTVSLYLYYT